MRLADWFRYNLQQTATSTPVGLHQFILTVGTFSIVEAAKIGGNISLNIPLSFPQMYCSSIALATTYPMPGVIPSHPHSCEILNQGITPSNTFLISQSLSHFPCPSQWNLLPLCDPSFQFLVCGTTIFSCSIRKMTAPSPVSRFAR